MLGKFGEVTSPDEIELLEIDDVGLLEVEDVGLLEIEELLPVTSLQVAEKPLKLSLPSDLKLTMRVLPVLVTGDGKVNPQCFIFCIS